MDGGFFKRRKSLKSQSLLSRFCLVSQKHFPGFPQAPAFFIMKHYVRQTVLNHRLFKIFNNYISSIRARPKNRERPALSPTDFPGGKKMIAEKTGRHDDIESSRRSPDDDSEFPARRLQRFSPLV